MSRAIACIALALILLVSGCGGTDVPATEAGASRAVPEMLAGVNAERRAAGVAPLVGDPALDRAAMAHAQDMASNRYFDHTAPDGSTPLRRMRAAGFQACYAAENIAKGQQDAAQVVRDWMASDGHRQNMLSPDPKAAGTAEGTGRHWVMVYARAC